MTEPELALTASELSVLATEQHNPRTADLDRLGTLEILHRLNDEDRTVADTVRNALPQLARAVDLAEGRWRRGGRVILFGAGTSGRLAVLDAAELGPTFRVDPTRYVARIAGGVDAVTRAVEGAEDDFQAGCASASDLNTQDVAFGIAASGRTPWVMGALESARKLGAATVALACVANPPLARVADVLMVVDTGPEAIAGSTRLKAGTAQKLVLNAFSTSLMVKLGKVHGNLMVDVHATNEKLRQRAVRLVSQICEVTEVHAESALRQADWHVKTAALVACLNIAPEAARERLAAANDHLGSALAEE